MVWYKVVGLLLLTYGRPLDHPRWGVKPLTEAVVRASNAADIDPALLLAIAIVESRLDYRATGGVGEQGLWQLHPKWHGDQRMLCGLDPDDCAHTQAQTAAMYLRSRIRACGSIPRGLGAYNTGMCGKGKSYAQNVRGEYLRIKQMVE